MTTGVTSVPATQTIDATEQAQIVSNFQSMLVSAGASERGAQRLANRLDHYISANPTASEGAIGDRAELLASRSQAAGGAAAEAYLIGFSTELDALEALMDRTMYGPDYVANQDDPSDSASLQHNAVRNNATSYAQVTSRWTSLQMDQSSITPPPPSGSDS